MCQRSRDCANTDRNGLLNARLGVADIVVVERDGDVVGYGCVEEYHEVETILGFA